MKRLVLVLVLLVASLSVGVNTSCDEEGRLLGLSSAEIIAGLKAALSISADSASASASAVNGFFNNQLIRIPLPEEVQPVADLLAKANQIPGVGSIISGFLSEQTGQFIKSMNRAAEIAAKPSGEIFVGAIKQMTIRDGLQILQGSDTAATAYLREKTSDSLIKVFAPVVSDAMGKAEVVRYWNDLARGYNDLMGNTLVKLAMPAIRAAVPDLPERLEVDLPRYVTQRGAHGLFTLMKGEEQKIRRDPLQYASDIVRKVFTSDEAKGGGR